MSKEESMVYVFDTAPLIVLFEYFYPATFPRLWQLFNELVDCLRVVSVREVANEIGRYAGQNRLTQWTKANPSFFPIPTSDEMTYVSEIFKQPHFQAMIEKRKRLEGQPVADPFVIARARALSGCVVAKEKYKPNAAKIPNICAHFKVDYSDLEGFMKRMGWAF